MWIKVLVVKPDFLRSIVNPVVNDYVKRGMPLKIASEIRRLILQAESKYKFTAYGGDVRNLKLYLESSEFNELVKFLEISNYRDLLLDILKKAKEAYSELEDLKIAIENIEKKLRQESFREGTGGLAISIDKLAELLQSKFNAKYVKVSKRAVRVGIDESSEIRVRLFRGKLIIEVLIKRVLSEATLDKVLEVISKLVEKAHRI
jgi:hypothetical protein